MQVTTPQPNQTTAPRLYSLSEAASLMHRCERTLRDMIAAGEGPRVIRIGRSKPLISDADLAEWLNRRAEQHAA